MKTTLVCIISFIFGLQNAMGGPATFAEFRQLPENDRKALVHDESNPMHIELVRWQWRLKLGEDAWQRKELQRLVWYNGTSNLAALFESYMRFRQHFIVGKLTFLNSSPSSPKVQRQAERFRRDYNAVEEQYADAIRDSCFLAPSPEAEKLITRANVLLGKWSKQYPTGENWNLSDMSMAKITDSYETIINSMHKLPTLSSAQVQSAIDALPKDSVPRFFAY